MRATNSTELSQGPQIQAPESEKILFIGGLGAKVIAEWSQDY